MTDWDDDEEVGGAIKRDKAPIGSSSTDITLARELPPDVLAILHAHESKMKSVASPAIPPPPALPSIIVDDVATEVPAAKTRSGKRKKPPQDQVTTGPRTSDVKTIPPAAGPRHLRHRNAYLVLVVAVALVAAAVFVFQR